MSNSAGEAIDGGMRSVAVDSGRAMSSAAKGAGKDTGSNELYKMNQVFYRAIPSLTTVQKRMLIRSNFQLNAYQNLQNQTIQCVLNTGELFCNGNQSFLVLQMGVPLPAGLVDTPKGYDLHAMLGPGGALSVLDEAWLVSASGTELAHEQNKGLQISHYLYNTQTNEYYRRNGIIEGLPDSNVSNLLSGRGYCRYDQGAAAGVAGPIQSRSGAYQSGGVDDDVTAGGLLQTIRNPILTEQGAVDISFNPNALARGRNQGQAPTFVIPLTHLLGCFNPYLRVLIPNAMLAGATLFLRFKNQAEPLTITGCGVRANAADNDAARLTYAQNFANQLQIYSIYILWDAYQMNDSVVKKINEISGSPNGLTYMYDTQDWTSTPAPGIGFVEAQVSQAKTRIKHSFAVVRDNAALTNPFIFSMCSEGVSTRTIGPYAIQNEVDTFPLTVNSYQAILGSLYFPQQPLTTLAEYYMNQLYTFRRTWQNPEDNHIMSKEDFAGAQGPAGAMYNAGVARSPTQNTGFCFPYGMGVFGFTAERSCLLQLTGQTISNARLLRHRFNFTVAPISGTSRIIDVFTTFTRQAKIFLGGRVVVRE